MISLRQRDGLNTAEIRNGCHPRAIEQWSNVSAHQVDSRVGESFDYSSVEPSVARFLRGQAERIRRQAATTVLQIGSALVQAKRYLSHGSFLIWVESEVGITARTAQLYMRAALWSSKKGKVVSGFPLSLVYLLSAPTTPTDFADGIVGRAAAGLPISLASIRRELKELNETAKKRVDGDLSDDAAAAGSAGSQLPVQNIEARAVYLLIEILARELPEDQFMSVRNVLTAIDNFELAAIVANALSAI